MLVDDRWRSNWAMVGPPGAVRVELPRSALKRRAAARSTPITSSMPASRSRCALPAASRAGYSQPTTTRVTPAATIASLHGGVRAGSLQGSIVT